MPPPSHRRSRCCTGGCCAATPPPHTPAPLKTFPTELPLLPLLRGIPFAHARTYPRLHYYIAVYVHTTHHRIFCCAFPACRTAAVILLLYHAYPIPSTSSHPMPCLPVLCVPSCLPYAMPVVGGSPRTCLLIVLCTRSRLYTLPRVPAMPSFLPLHYCLTCSYPSTCPYTLVILLPCVMFAMPFAYPPFTTTLLRSPSFPPTCALPYTTATALYLQF